MNLVLIDVGNTRAKIVLSKTGQFIERRTIATAAIDPASICEAMEGWDYDGAALCSVVPDANMAFEAALGKDLLILSHETDLGIGIEYPEPATIGADRLADAVALAKIYGAPGIAIDFGTAVTFDLLSADSNYIGGVIAPGLEMMNDYMSERTALLPRVALIKRPPAIGKSTKQAMQSGAYFGYLGMVRQILEELLLEMGYPDKITIIGTGGAADLFCDALPVTKIDPDLTLHGLRLIAERNFLPESSP